MCSDAHQRGDHVHPDDKRHDDRQVHEHRALHREQRARRQREADDQVALESEQSERVVRKHLCREAQAPEDLHATRAQSNRLRLRLRLSVSKSVRARLAHGGRDGLQVQVEAPVGVQVEAVRHVALLPSKQLIQ